MKINNTFDSQKDLFKSAGFTFGDYDREVVRENTLKTPEWVHFGAGNIMRAFQANLLDRLLEEKKMSTGLIVAEGFDYEIIDKVYKPCDNLGILVTLKADGTMEKKVIGSIAEALVLDRDRTADFERLMEVFASESLKMASFTITEKGYMVKTPTGELLPGTAADVACGPYKASSYIGKVVSLLYHRFESGAYPVAMVSMDNCSHNGDKLFDAVITLAEGWVKNGLASEEFLSYVKDEKKVSFPWSMIDKITPRPDERVLSMLEKDGVEDIKPVITSKNTYVAPFVNAEETEYLVVEDSFPNGRIPLDEAGVIYTNRETVDKTERMKVCTCLNPLHTSLAIYGCLLGYTSIHDEMDDPELSKLVDILGHVEGMPVVVNPGVLNPNDFLEAVLKKRLPNPFMPDTPQRIACDTSMKLPIRFGQTIIAYRKSSELSTDSLTLIPLVLAGYLRYLQGIDDEGNEFTLSPDPKLEDLRTLDPKDVLKREDVFGVNLFEDGLGDRILTIFDELNSGNGAVRATLKKYIYK